jgi:broad specificity phosphatase PhoE
MSPGTVRSYGAMRRRLYLMRHGAVSYFRPDGTPVREDEVVLNERGRAQAVAARELLGEIGFDRVLTSGLPRTVETAGIVAPGADLERWPELRELRGARLADIPSERLEEEFVHAFRGVVPNDKRFLGGETIGELFDRVLPAVERLLADRTWDTVLAVLHGGVNRAILSYALTGERMYLGPFEQAPGCVNVLDVGARPESASADSGRANTWCDEWIVRTVNVAPLDLLHASTRLTTMEGYWEEFSARRAGTATGQTEV